MSFNSWLQNLKSTCGLGSGSSAAALSSSQPAAAPQRRPRPAPLFLEQLETRLTPSLSTLASFIAPAGSSPQAAVIMDSSGNLYGTTEAEAPPATARFSSWPRPAARITALASFNGTNGANPHAGLIMDSSGNLYGTTSAGGASGDGTVFELAQGSGTITTLASFNGTNGAYPSAALIMDSSGNLYGTTYGGGASS